MLIFSVSFQTVTETSKVKRRHICRYTQSHSDVHACSPDSKAVDQTARHQGHESSHVALSPIWAQDIREEQFTKKTKHKHLKTKNRFFSKKLCLVVFVFLFFIFSFCVQLKYLVTFWATRKMMEQITKTKIKKRNHQINKHSEQQITKLKSIPPNTNKTLNHPTHTHTHARVNTQTTDTHKEKS